MMTSPYEWWKILEWDEKTQTKKEDSFLSPFHILKKTQTRLYIYLPYTLPLFFSQEYQKYMNHSLVQYFLIIWSFLSSYQDKTSLGGYKIIIFQNYQKKLKQGFFNETLIVIWIFIKYSIKISIVPKLLELEENTQCHVTIVHVSKNTRSENNYMYYSKLTDHENF